MSPVILVDIAHGIATITLNRPERKNAFTFEMIDQWADAMDGLRCNDAVDVVVITGAGEAFCSGADLSEMQARLGRPADARKNELWNGVQRIPRAAREMEKPVLVALRGVAVGAGLDLALAADIRYAGESARFAETYVRVGLVPGAGGAHFLPRLIGTARALELFWTGATIDAREAERIGLVNKVLPDAEVLPAVQALARQLADAPRQSVRMMKRLVYQGVENDLRSCLDMASSHHGVVAGSEQHRKAVEALFGRNRGGDS